MNGSDNKNFMATTLDFKTRTTKVLAGIKGDNRINGWLKSSSVRFKV